ncbi:MAG: FtsX-like permease family protein [Clostridia bacterium]|nr:FtsX-like permease family protein [Clostridia bacterium]
MGIIIKFIVRNLKEKKLRTFLIIFSVMISSALFFASRASSDYLVKLTIEQMKSNYGNADVIIVKGEKSPSPYFSTNQAEKYLKDLEYIIGAIQETGFYKYPDNRSDRFNLFGFDYGDLKTMNPIALEKENALEPFSGKKIILSKKTAQKYNVTAGDPLELDINNQKHRFLVVGIAYPSGVFLNEGELTNAIVPKETLASFFDAQGKANNIYIKLKNSKERPQILKLLSESYKRYAVREPFTMAEVRSATGGMSTAFMLMTILVFCMSTFIIYSSFKVITTERMPVIGTFRSVGASRKTTDWVLLMESVVYGILGGLLGCGAGIGLFYIITAMTAPSWAKNIQERPGFSVTLLGISFLLAILLTVISSMLPIVRISRIPVKDIVLNKVEKKISSNRNRQIWGLVFIIFVIAAPLAVPRNIALYIDALCVVLSVAAVIMLTPLLTELIVKIFERLYIMVFGNIGSLAAKNLRNNKSILNNISLLSIGISSLLVINTLSFSALEMIANLFSVRSYEIMLAYPEADKSFERSIASIDGVKSVYSIYEDHRVEVVGRDHRLTAIQGVDSNKYLDYWKFEFEGNAREMLKGLDEGRNILVTTVLRDTLGVKIGDELTLKMKKGNRTYKISGFYISNLFNGNYILMSNKFLKMDMDTQYFYRIYVKTDEIPQKTFEDIKERLARKQPDIWLVEQMNRENRESYSRLFGILRGFSIMTLVIGIFGVFNNFIISFIERRRSLAVYRSIGMSRSQIIRMIFIEALTGGLAGGSIGVGAGFLLIKTSEYVLKAINQPIDILYSPDTFWISFSAGIIITVAASISPAIKSSKLNIIQSIKYE